MYRNQTSSKPQRRSRLGIYLTGIAALALASVVALVVVLSGRQRVRAPHAQDPAEVAERGSAESAAPDFQKSAASSRETKPALPPPRLAHQSIPAAVSAPPPPADPPNPAAPAAADKPTDVYAALSLNSEQIRQSKEVLRIQRDRVKELSQSLRERKMTLPEFRKAIRDLGQETDGNLVSVFGEKKLEEWRRFQSDQDPVPELPPSPAKP